MRHKKTASQGNVGLSPNFGRLAALRLKELETEFLKGSTPSEDALAGWEFRGLNVPSAMRYVGIRKFVKGFYRHNGELWGYNCPVEQNDDEGEWHSKPSDDTPERFGFYKVHAVDASATDNKYLHALLLDYGKGLNPATDPSRGLRDYLVQIDDDVMLGIAYFALGGKLRLRLPSYFILNRFRSGIGDISAIR